MTYDSTPSSAQVQRYFIQALGRVRPEAGETVWRLFTQL
jgi:hypothetical protein